MKILVAEDDRSSRLVMRSMLLNSGYEVVAVEDGAAAAERLLAPDGPRLALLDWMMPGLNGPEICRAIRAQEDRAYIYVILLTARDSKDDLVAGLQAGADDYITKPCYPEELRARLRTGVRVLKLEDSLIEAREEMRYRATHDSLTRLLNRGSAVHALGTALARAAAAEEQIGVVLADIDHFKSINDAYGHPAGDAVLRAAAERMRQVVSQTGGGGMDVIGRFGGEEFLIVLQGPRDRVPVRAEAVRAAVEAVPFQTEAGELHVTVSMGALEITPRAGFSVDEVLRQVDELLYDAKRGGRNRVVVRVEERAKRIDPAA